MTVPDGLGLGRIPASDPRDRSFMMGEVMPAADPGVTYRYWWPSGMWRDQGATGTCVGHAWAHWIEDGPVTHPGEIDPFLIYREATQRDPWPENDDGDLQYGTSVRAAAKWLQETGRIHTYRWSWDASTIRNTLLRWGPVVVGTNWYESMFDPDPDGHVTISGDIAGGHAYVLNGINLETSLVRFKNSWGRGWGKRGYGYLSFDELDRLIGEGGEAVIATHE